MSSRLPKLMTASLAAILFTAAQAASVQAGNIIDFSMNNVDSIALTDNGDYTLAYLQTTGGLPASAPGGPTGGEQAITISVLNGVTESSPMTAYLSLNSIADSRPSLSPASQDFSGSFAITQNDDGTGINYLSGSFSNWTLSGSGSDAILEAADSSASSTLTSDVITSLSSASVIPFVFANVTPAVQVLYENGRPTHVLAPFTAGAAAVPEPSSLVLAGLGALGLAGYARRRRKTTGA